MSERKARGMSVVYSCIDGTCHFRGGSCNVDDTDLGGLLMAGVSICEKRLRKKYDKRTDILLSLFHALLVATNNENTPRR